MSYEVVLSEAKTVAIQAELQQVLASEDFAASQHLSRFLRYIVEQSLAGNAERLKERTVARNALDRGADFDSRFDPIVRVVAGKLRRALDRYYAKDGLSNALKIEMPKGGYRPVFQQRDEDEIPATETASPERTAETSLQDDSLGRPVVAILPFVTFGGGEEIRCLADGLAQDLCIHLSRYSWIQVIDYLMTQRLPPHEAAPWSLPSRLKADYCLWGTFREVPQGCRITLQFLQADNGVVIWGESFDCKSGKNLQHELDRLARNAALLLGDVFGILSRAIRSASLTKRTEKATAIESLFQFFDYEMHLGDKDYTRIVQSVTKIVRAFPNVALAWSALATLHLNGVAMVSKTKSPDASQQALYCVQQALKADPSCAFAHWSSGLYHLMHGNPEESLAAAERTVEHANGAPFEVGAAGAMLTINGQAERGLSLIEQATRLNAGLPGWVQWTAAIHQLDQGEYQEALAASEHFSIPDCFWDPLLRSVALTGVGEKTEGDLLLQRAVNLRPELAERPQELVGRIIHRQEARRQIIERVKGASVS